MEKGDKFLKEIKKSFPRKISTLEEDLVEFISMSSKFQEERNLCSDDIIEILYYTLKSRVIVDKMEGSGFLNKLSVSDLLNM